MGVTVLLIGGAAHAVEVAAHDTVRSLLTRVPIDCPDHSRAIFIANGCVLQPDFSLASQGIAAGAEIRVLLRRRPTVPRPCVRKTNADEVLRLADLSFRRFEIGRSQRRMALRLESLAQRSAAGQRTDLLATKVVAAVDISADPLPCAWTEAVEDGSLEHPHGL
jgi:hypothetical protein